MIIFYALVILFAIFSLYYLSVTLSPKTIRNFLQWRLPALGLIIFLFLALTGKLALIWMAILPLLPWLRRILVVHSLWKRFGFTRQRSHNTQNHSNQQYSPPPNQPDMAYHEALNILGLEDGASHKQIKKAHHELMKTAHPDRGGSLKDAQRLNVAKDILLS
jgi:hypothetical protein